MRHIFATMLVLGTITATAQADIFKCPDGKGGVVFRDVSCPSANGAQPVIATGARAEDVAPPAAPDTSPLPFKDKMCQDLGTLAFTFAKGRDRGVLLSQGLAVIETEMAKTEYRRLFEPLYRHTLLEVHRKTWWTPSVAQQQIEVWCVQQMAQSSHP